MRSGYIGVGALAAAALLGAACDGLIGLSQPASAPTDAAVESHARVPDTGGVDRTPDSLGDGGADADGASEAATDSGGDETPSVLQFHMNASRDGHYVDPAMTPQAAARLVLDGAFDAGIAGPLLGQPLYVANGVHGKGTIYVADDSNNIYALDERTGSQLWARTPLASPAGRAGPVEAGSGCGNVRPVGVTGTPIIDPESRTIYLVAAVGTSADIGTSFIKTQEIHALNIDDGSEVKGWPIDISKLTSGGLGFDPTTEGQRGALSLVNGVLYAPFGGGSGDCGHYHGWVVSVPVTDPSSASSFTTTGQGGAIWAAGGMSSDGIDLFAATGNAKYVDASAPWSMATSEAVLRFGGGSFPDLSNTANFFTPSNWQSLDGTDGDLGSSTPLVVDVPGATPSKLVIQLGKSGVVHILDRANLGGIGTGNGTSNEGLYSDLALSKLGVSMRTTPATFTTASGTFVVFDAFLSSADTFPPCPSAASVLVAVQITATMPPTFAVSWCVNSGGPGAPIVTTTDASGANPIVWIVGGYDHNTKTGTMALTGWRGETGAKAFDGLSMPMSKVMQYVTPINVNGGIIVGARDRVYAFRPKR